MATTYPYRLPKPSDLTPYERREYQRLRQEGTPLAQALLLAGKDHGGPDVPCRDGETFKRDGFLLTVHIKTDEYCTPDEVGLGRYVSTEEPGRTVDRVRAGYHVARHEHRFFLPDCTEEEHIRSGASREEARRYVLQDLARAESYGSEWVYLTIRVTAERAGVELGSSPTIGGVEDDSGDRYIRDLVNEHADEAIEEAKEALEALCGCAE